jgi:hypothetical protein
MLHFVRKIRPSIRNIHNFQELGNIIGEKKLSLVESVRKQYATDESPHAANS